MSGSPSSMPPYDNGIHYIERPAVVVRDVRKRYSIGRGSSRDAGRKKTRRTETTVEALRGVSLVAMPGESIGVIGLNGSGKSTLLRMISGGEMPTSGEVRVRSKPMLMGVSPALQKELTGEQNIYLGCLALGMNSTQARNQIRTIGEWTELGEAIKRPMATYSSGMGSRLNFAISTAVEPEILLIDEALSTGDAAFGAKAEERIQSLIKKTGNLFLVSHAIGVIEKLCDRCIWVYQGAIIADGPTDVIAPQYHEWARLMGKDDKDPADVFLSKVKEEYAPPLILIES